MRWEPVSLRDNDKGLFAGFFTGFGNEKPFPEDCFIAGNYETIIVNLLLKR